MTLAKYRKSDNQKHSLNHVCMWTQHGWTRVTAEEVAKIHPGGKVSAHSGLFMCELCGQYVTLASGPVIRPYFKHTREEESKNCPERTFASSSPKPKVFKPPELPIRIAIDRDFSFHFEVGLVRVPENLLSEDLRLVIVPDMNNSDSFTYERNRLYENSTTYLSIGNSPYESYSLTLSKNSDKLHRFWPKKIKGIDPNGTLFDKESRKMLPRDSDVMVGKSYYFLKQGGLNKNKSSSLVINKLKESRPEEVVWNLYEISAKRMDEQAAKFFLGFHYRLTDNPVSIQVVWPLFVKEEDLIKHNQNQIDLIVKGNITSVSPFPKAITCKYPPKAGLPAIYEVDCLEREQFITVGRSEDLQSVYFWKEPLNKEGGLPNLIVFDMEGNPVVAGISNKLPVRKMLSFKSDYDGEIHLLKKNRLIDKLELKAGNIQSINNLTYGLSVQVTIGLDLIWQIEFNKQKVTTHENEQEILSYVTGTHSRQIPIPHALRNMLTRFKKYPQVSNWIKKRLAKGTIDLLSYRRLQEIYLENQ